MMVKDSSFSSVSTDDSYSEQDQGNHDNVMQDPVVKEEAREWKETHKISATSPNFTVSPVTPVAMVTPVTMVTPISTSTPYYNAEKSSFNHFRLTESGLVPMETHLDKSPSDLKHLEELKCKGCNKTYSNTLTLHKHECFKFKCAECGYRSVSEETMYQHVASRHQDKVYKCGICDEGFKGPECLEKHLNSVHDTPYNCNKCGLVFVKFDLYKTHCMALCCAAEEEECGECGAAFHTLSSLKEHMTTKHMTSSPVSLTSSLSPGLHGNSLHGNSLDLSLSTQALLLKHSFLQKLVSDLQTGLEKNTLLAKPLARFPPAARCNNLLNNSPLFYPTALKPLSPDLAKYSNVTSPDLTKYGGVTSPDMTKYSNVTSPDLTKYGQNVADSLLKCNQCAVSFSTFSELHSHLLLHTVTMTTALQHSASEGYCSECDTQFPNKLTLEEHMKSTHESERPYKCNHCDKTFTRSNNLQEHLRTHTGSRPYVCSYCDKSFARSSILHIHMRTHTKIKPFQCSVCPAAFSHSNSLQAHLRRHTGAKPYVCPVCSKAFRQSGTLHRHIRTHNKTKRPDQLISPKPELPVPFTGNHGNYTGNHGNYTGNHANYANLALKLLGELGPLSGFPSNSPSLNKENRPDLKASLQLLEQVKQQL